MLGTTRTLCVALAASAAVAMAGTTAAMAGGLKDEPVADIAVHDWSGFYVGIGVGIGSFDHDAWAEGGKKKVIEKKNCDSCDAFTKAVHGDFHHSDDLWDGFGTIQLGLDRQMGRFVLGAFADYDWHFDAVSKFSDSAKVDNLYSYGEKEWTKGHSRLSIDGELEKEGVWSLGGRFGFLATPRLLIYGLAGYSELLLDGKINLEIADHHSRRRKHGTTDLALNVDENLSGYILGVGGEALLSDNLALKLEYRYGEYDGTTLNAKDASYKDRGKIKKWSEKYATVKIDDVEEHSVRAVLAFRLGHERAAPISSLK